MIITTTTGDKTYLSKNIKEVFLETGTYHLVALSGSNIVIVLWLVKILNRKYSTSSFVMTSVVLSLYFLFTDKIHPLARATLFMILNELYTYTGVKASVLRKVFILSICSIYLYYWSGFSISMFLSLYFCFAIIFFNILKDKFFPDLNPLLCHSVFSLHIAVLSFPIYLFIFKEPYSPVFLLSNLIVVPIFELFLYLFYISYLLALGGVIDYVPFQLLIIQELLFYFLNLYFKFFVL